MKPKTRITSGPIESFGGAIPDEDRLIRRINSKHHVIFDEKLGKRRVSTKAFSVAGADNKMSVDLERCIQDRGEDPSKYVTQREEIDGAVVFSAAVVRQKNLEVERAPEPDNPCHGNVFRVPKLGKLTSCQKRHLQDRCEWLVEIQGVRLRKD